MRAVKQGVPVTYESEAVVLHHYDSTVAGLFRWGPRLTPARWGCDSVPIQTRQPFPEEDFDVILTRRITGA